MKAILITFALLAVIAQIDARSKMLLNLTQLNVAGCDGTPNDKPLITEQPQLVKTVQNGKLFTQNYDQRLFYVVVLNGSSYDMGLAYGQLMKEEIKEVVKGFFKWAEGYIENNITFITKLPKFLRIFVGKTGVSIAKFLLDLNYFATEKYTPKRWNEEMRGLEKATGISIWTFRQMNLLPELLKASCSIMGGFNQATATGNVIHLRSLDWEQHAPISRYPTVAVYHSTEPGSVVFANIAWAGFIGSLTGYNAAKVGVGERLRGGDNKDMTRYGTPWTYVLRDMLQFSKNMNESITYLQNADRTCSIYLGIGSGIGTGNFTIEEYCYAYLNYYTWQTWHFDGNHPEIPDLLWKEYHSGTPCFKNILVPNYGNIDPELVYRVLAPLGQTGDSQVVTMDYANDVIYCNYPNPFTFEPGYVCPTIKIDLKPFFSSKVLESKL